MIVGALVGCGGSDPPPGDAASDAAQAGDAGADAADGEITYAALSLIGALDRVVITRADTAADLCAGIRLVTPEIAGKLAIMTPTDWAVELAYVAEGTLDCHSDPFPMTPEFGVTGSGVIHFVVDPGRIYPDILDVNATVMFQSALPWVPASVTFAATDLTVQ